MLEKVNVINNEIWFNGERVAFLVTEEGTSLHNDFINTITQGDAYDEGYKDGQNAA